MSTPTNGSPLLQSPRSPARRAVHPGLLLLVPSVLVAGILARFGPAVLSRTRAPPRQDAPGPIAVLAAPADLSLAVQLPAWAACPAQFCPFSQLSDDGADEEAVPSPPIALDEWLRQRFFYRRAGGLFVEVGAGGGLAPESATHLLAQHGWHGLLTEARPAQYAALAASRREAVCVNAAPCAEFSGQADELSVVPCVPLQHLLDRFAIDAVDVLVLRAEGGQAAAALASLDLARLSLGVVAFAGSDSRGNATKEAATKLLQQGFAEVPLAELPAAFAARSRVLWSRQAAHRFRRAPILQRL